ncbi:AAA family ATPase [Candidatus Kaiserbacteria bacterium]|nr:AAA family ATPase [Candidatus Kaiserbacteria bacterium]
MTKTIFVSGANGVGKSTVIPHLINALATDVYEVHDFDERGVPEDAGRTWRISETKYWIQRGEELAEKGRVLIICGFVKIEDFDDAKDSLGSDILLILLDAEQEVIKTRLMARYTRDGEFEESQTVIGMPVQKFVENSLYTSRKLRSDWESAGYPVVETSDLNPTQVAQEVARIISLS